MINLIIIDLGLAENYDLAILFFLVFGLIVALSKNSAFNGFIFCLFFGEIFESFDLYNYKPLYWFLYSFFFVFLFQLELVFYAVNHTKFSYQSIAISNPEIRTLSNQKRSKKPPGKKKNPPDKDDLGSAGVPVIPVKPKSPLNLGGFKKLEELEEENP